jgi:hypothetical protein
MYWELRGLGVELVALVNDTPDVNYELRERLDLPFSLLSDPDAEIARRYDTFHDNEPKGRDIARVAMFYISPASQGGEVMWEHVSPTHHHRVPPSMLVERVQEQLGRERKTVSVLVPDEPSSFDPASNEQILKSEITMGANTEIHRLVAAGWRLVATAPAFGLHGMNGNRWVFVKP